MLRIIYAKNNYPVGYFSPQLLFISSTLSLLFSLLFYFSTTVISHSLFSMCPGFSLSLSLSLFLRRMLLSVVLLQDPEQNQIRIKQIIRSESRIFVLYILTISFQLLPLILKLLCCLFASFFFIFLFVLRSKSLQRPQY